jgi:hypothetical protein
MPDEPRVQELLDELLDRDATPEEVCGACLDLLPVVRERWQQICRLRAELDALLPAGPHEAAPTLPPEGPPLPAVPGYAVEAVIGYGGMGVVFRARHLRLGRLVALKMALAGSYAGAQERERFRREAEAVAALRHPNVVQVYDVGDAGGQPYFTMEFMEGGSLAHQLTGTPQPARQTARLLATLAGAVEAAHRSGIVHRDLKPGNVLLTADGTPKISDFGLARRLDHAGGLTRTGAALGTPSYMAPEQARGKTGAVGPAADVYALGAILYELLTGRPPFMGETAAETVLQVLYQEPVPPSRLNSAVPRDLETVCLKCLRKQPERRYFSAQELADDLGRFVRGEPVTAQPVGRLERVAKWVRRNPTVAGLSAVAALALVAGSVVSLLFGVEAHRKADELEQQTIQLQAQTRAARENARRAEENEKEAVRVLLSGLLIPIGRNPHRLTDPLDAAEADAVRQLRAAPAPVRLQFLETALRDPETARRVGSRAGWVVQAIVGCDRALRADVARLLVRRIQEPDAPHDVVLACARLGVAVNLGDPAWAERSAPAVMAALRDPRADRADYPHMAETLAAVSEHLPPARAADHADEATTIFLKVPQDGVIPLATYEFPWQAVTAVSPRLDAAVATRVAAALVALIRESALPPVMWESISKALVAVCRRLPPADSAARLNEMVDVIATRGTTKEKEKYAWTFHSQALGALGGRLDAAGAARVAEALVGFLGDSETVGDRTREFVSNVVIAKALTEVAERLDARGGLRAAEGLILVLRKAGPLIPAAEPLRTALAAVCRRLDAAGAARVSGAVVAAVRDPKTSAEVRTVLAGASAAIAGKLDPAAAAALEGAVVDALVADVADAKAGLLQVALAQALATVCGRPGARSAARAAETLTAAIRDHRTSLGLLVPLAKALAEVGGQLPPAEAASYANRAVAVLGPLWVTSTEPLVRAQLAEALAAVWTRLEPAEAAAHARRAAADLEAAIRDAKPRPHELLPLAEALVAVYAHLGAAERAERATAVADALLAALRRPNNDLQTILYLSEGLAALCAHLDRPGVVRVADALLTVLGDTNVQPGVSGPILLAHLDRFSVYERVFKKVAARLDERDLRRLLEHPLAAGRLQRVLLDFLAVSKDRPFRNTWDYLDGTESNENGAAGLSPGTN